MKESQFSCAKFCFYGLNLMIKDWGAE